MTALRSSQALSISFGGVTDVGKRRDNNEDSLLWTRLAVGTEKESVLLIVSDGVGGAKAGEVASNLAVNSMRDLIAGRLAAEAPPTDRRDWLDRAIRETDRHIRTEAEKPGQNGMGATLSALWIAGQSAWWGQAGDSRIYQWRGGVLTQLSQDQSLIGRLRANGQIDEEQARAHPYRHVIDQCLGGNGAPLDPETGKLTIEANDVYLLCSDGVTDGLWDRDIAENLKALAATHPPDEIARALVHEANEASGNDNITAVVARVDRDLPATKRGPKARAATSSALARWLARLGWK
jgi:protein phosphatase